MEYATCTMGKEQNALLCKLKKNYNYHKKMWARDNYGLGKRF